MPTFRPLLLAAMLLAGCREAHHEPPSPQVGEEARAAPALPVDEEAGLLAGQGLGQAKPAELNRYPGPRHVLELASELGLDERQEAETRRSFARMEAEAQRLGRLVVEREHALEALFARAAADSAQVRLLSEEIGRLRGELRFVHLNAHLEMRRLLAPEQLAAYDRLRGYDAPGAGEHHAHDG